MVCGRALSSVLMMFQRIDSRLRSQEKDALKKRLKEEQAAAKQQTVPEAEELLPAPENAPASAAVVREKPAAAVIRQEMPQSGADELKKYKELLDGGVISQEEFDAKKKQLLGL